MLRHVALVRTDVSEELSVSFIRVTRIGELGTTLALNSNRRTLPASQVARTLRHQIHRAFGIMVLMLVMCSLAKCWLQLSKSENQSRSMMVVENNMCSSPYEVWK
jgi:ABC-type Fe3+ transport system permease subunit